MAEDNEINQKLIRRTLEDLGLNITIVPNGLQALERRKTDTFDMIFMDIAMPVMDGIEATHKILEYEEKNHQTHIPIVAITANALKGDRERFMKEGLDEYITKPIKKDNIINILNVFMHNKIDNEATTNEVQPEIAPISNPETKVEETIEHSPSFEALTVNENESNEPIIPALSSVVVKDILVLKKSPIETKIFTSVLSKMCENVDASTSYNDLKNKLQSNHYKLVLFDKEMLLEDLESFASIVQSITNEQNLGKIHTVMFVDPKDKNLESTVAFDAILPNQISKKDLETLIHKFI